MSVFSVSKVMPRIISAGIPLGTLVVNMTGCFLIGFFFEHFEESHLSAEVKSLITVGFLGALTTFSTYTLETINLLRDGEIKYFIFNIVIHNVVGILCAVAGILVFRYFFN